MRLDRFGISRLALLAFMALALNGLAPGQDNNQASNTGIRAQDRMVSSGERTKVAGIIIRRDADTFSVADDATGKETVVLLTDRTSVRSKGGFLRSGKDYEVTSLLRGLRVDVEGRGNASGQLVADKVRFNANDLRFAKVVDSRVAPVEEANQHLSGQVAEAN
ncbi:MAG TPA: hypothetical protein VI756_00045, partial [Blastocatellia bacterium]